MQLERPRTAGQATAGAPRDPINPTDTGSSEERPAPLQPSASAWPPPLDRHLAADANAGQVADAVAAVWVGIDNTLQPIIGRRGVAALYNRSLRLSEAEYPWLSEGHQGNLSALETGALKATLSRHLPHEAARAGAAHFQSFQGLLASLVGPLLTERLLGSIWASAPDNPAAQDAAP